MSSMQEIKQRLDRMTELGNGMKEQLAALNSPEIKKKTRAQGKKLGAGVGVSLLGMVVAFLASLYIIAVVILAVNAGLNKPWLSALIVVGGFLVIGGIIIGIGAAVAAPAAKEMKKTTEEIMNQMKKNSEAMKAEVEAMQELAKKEAEGRQEQARELLEQAKLAAPAAGIALLVLRFVHRRMKARREKKRILKVIEAYDRSAEED